AWASRWRSWVPRIRNVPGSAGGGRLPDIRLRSQNRFARVTPTERAFFNGSGRPARLLRTLRGAGDEAGERALGLGLAREGADHIAGARGGRAARRDTGAHDDDLSGRIAHQ